MVVSTYVAYFWKFALAARVAAVGAPVPLYWGVMMPLEKLVPSAVLFWATVMVPVVASMVKTLLLVPMVVSVP